MPAVETDLNMKRCASFGTYHQVWLLPLVEQGQQLPGVVQVVARHPAEAERVQVAEGDRRERHDRGRDLIQFGDVRVLEVEVDPVHAHVQQEGQGAQEKHDPQAALDAEPLVRENVGDAVQGRAVRKNFYGRRLIWVHFLAFYFEIHCHCATSSILNARVWETKPKKKKKTASKQFKLTWFSFTCGASCNHPPRQVQTCR